MKLLIATIFLIMLLVLPACENGVVISYNADDLGSVRFIKTEKIVTASNDLNCEYSDASHNHSQYDEYYVYFTLSSESRSPINPESPRFTNIKNDLEIKFQKRIQGSDNFEIDSNVRTVGDIEFVSPGKNLKETQRFNFLIDVMLKDDCNGVQDPQKDDCSLSSSLTPTLFGDLLNQISASLTNSKSYFDDKDSFFIEDDFLNVKYMALSSNEGSSSWYYRMTSRYIDDMDDCTGSMNSSNKAKIKCWLTLNDDNTYKWLKSDGRKHRKLYDGYIDAVETLGNDTKENKNLLFFVSGYEEAYYESGSSLGGTLSDGNKSINDEAAFFNAIKPSDNIPVFIAPHFREDKDSFPGDGVDIDNKFYKLACLTGGAYFPGIYKDKTIVWTPVTQREYNYEGLMGNIKEASYGMWRIRVKLEDTTSERVYEGGISLKAKNSQGEDVTTSLVGYRVIR